MTTITRVLPCLFFAATTACTFESTSDDGSDTEDATDTDSEADTESGMDSNVNVCNPLNLEKPPIWAALGDLPCTDANTRVQAAADVTVGSTGQMVADLPPILVPFSQIEGMCPVNVHWHLGAEHRNTGTYDIPGAEWMRENDPNHHPSADVEPGNFCPGYNPADPKFTTPYAFQHCSEHMRVGYTYEIHWPHSNLGACGTEWQYQSHFMNGVLCKANEVNMPVADAVNSVFGTQTTKIGVQAQVFTIVNDSAYDYPTWNAMGGWNSSLARDVAFYQGSTTGQQNGNVTCRGTGGMVSWQVDRGCNLISAWAFDELCRVMKEQKVDMSGDTHAHNARVTTSAAITTDVPM